GLAREGNRTQARVRPQALGAGQLRSGLIGELLGAVLEESGVHLVRERDVQAVKPGHRLGRNVVVTVVVPTRGQKEVTTTHRNRVTVDHRPDTLAFDDETEGVLGVAVLRGVLTRCEVLDRSPQ